MPIRFDDEEDAYVRWLAEHPDGFVANVDRARTMPQYPMLHLASHGLISSERIGGFTTGAYLKICGTDLTKLEGALTAEYGRKPTRCDVCMGRS